MLEKEKRIVIILLMNKVDVTSDFLRCITQWLDNQKTVITTDTGKEFEVTCKEIKGGKNNGK
jgi:IS30 family transposase